MLQQGCFWNCLYEQNFQLNYFCNVSYEIVLQTFQLNCFWNLSHAINYTFPPIEGLGGEHLLVKNRLGENKEHFTYKVSPKIGLQDESMKFFKAKCYNTFFCSTWISIQHETFQKDLRNVSIKKVKHFRNVVKYFCKISERSLKAQNVRDSST